MLNGKLQNLV